MVCRFPLHQQTLWTNMSFCNHKHVSGVGSADTRRRHGSADHGSNQQETACQPGEVFNHSR
jgi:hypothetical protein